MKQLRDVVLFALGVLAFGLVVSLPFIDSDPALSPRWHTEAAR